MAKKSAALLGPGEGPAVRLAGASSRVQIRGLRAAESAQIFQQLYRDEGLAVLSVAEDGIFELARCSYARVVYRGENRSFIACMLIGD